MTAARGGTVRDSLRRARTWALGFAVLFLFALLAVSPSFTQTARTACSAAGTSRTRSAPAR